MSTHTPGPWSFVAGNQIRSTKHQISKVWMMRDSEGIANAHLIAAAPELLQSLKRAETVLRNYEAWVGLADEFKREIAKATGGAE